MDKKWINELLWLGWIVILPLLAIFAQSEERIVFNVHDTYFVMDKLTLAAVITIPLLFVVYLIRVISNRFNNLIANCIFMVASCIAIVLIGNNPDNSAFWIIIMILLLVLLILTAYKTRKKLKAS